MSLLVMFVAIRYNEVLSGYSRDRKKRDSCAGIFKALIYLNIFKVFFSQSIIVVN